MLSVDVHATGPVPLEARLRVRAGELLALVGPSGSGKSTLLRTIAGLWRPVAGSVHVDDVPWLDTRRGLHVPVHRRRVGMVFQSWALFPHLSALDNVALAIDGRSKPERRTRARELLGQVRLDGLGERLPAQLSGGQQQRVALARALAREPRVLLLDEPFSAVDRATRERLYRELAEMRQRLTMPAVLVTHDLDEAMRLADRMVVIHHGRTLQEGTPNDVTQRPDSPEVARLVGLRNVFSGRVAGSDGIDWAGLRLQAPEGDDIDGADVHWCIPDGFVILHRRDRPSHGERENPVPVRVLERLDMGPTAHLTLQPLHDPSQPLHVSVPVHVAERNAVRAGVEARVSLLAEGIHRMRG